MDDNKETMLVEEIIEQEPKIEYPYHLNTGMEREVYQLEDGNVIKIPRFDKECNIAEYNNWKCVEGTEYEKWFAPCVELREDYSLVMEKIDRNFMGIIWFYFPKILLESIQDLDTSYNWGLYKGRLVCFDYSRGILNNLPEYKEDTIIDFRIKRAIYSKDTIYNHNVFCYGPQPPYSCFNKCVGEKRFHEISLEVRELLGSLTLTNKELRKLPHQIIWNKLLEIPEAKDFQDGLNYILKYKLMTIEDKKEYAESLQVYQSVNLDDEVILKSAPPWSHDSVAQFNTFGFPSDFTGKTFIDLGCNIGAYCVEAKRRGALLSEGIDISNVTIQIAKDIADIVDLDIKYQVNNFHNMLEYNGPAFDVVSALSIFHHILYPKGVIRLFRRLTKELFIGEFFCYREGMNCDKMEELPEVMDNPSYGYGPYPTIECIIRELSELFSEVEVRGKGKRNERYIVHAKV